MKHDVRPMSTETFISAPAGFAIIGGGSSDVSGDGVAIGA